MWRKAHGGSEPVRLHEEHHASDVRNGAYSFSFYIRSICSMHGVFHSCVLLLQQKWSQTDLYVDVAVLLRLTRPWAHKDFKQYGLKYRMEEVVPVIILTFVVKSLNFAFPMSSVAIAKRIVVIRTCRNWTPRMKIIVRIAPKNVVNILT